MAEAAVPLASLKAGQTAILKEILLPEETRERLLELGLLAGTPVRVERFAPLGDPVEITFRGCHLTLRRHEADRILVGPGS